MTSVIVRKRWVCFFYCFVLHNYGAKIHSLNLKQDYVLVWGVAGGSSSEMGNLYPDQEQTTTKSNINKDTHTHKRRRKTTKLGSKRTKQKKETNPWRAKAGMWTLVTDLAVLVFFCVSQLCFWGSLFWVRFLHYVTVFRFVLVVFVLVGCFFVFCLFGFFCFFLLFFFFIQPLR